MVIAIFIAGLVFSIANSISIIYALLFGLIIFSVNALMSGYTIKQVAIMALNGSKKTKNVIILLFLIGAVTGIWRGCGVIPYIVYNSVNLIQPKYFLLSAFLLCSAISIITGTAFGTASTMGVVLVILGNMNGINITYICGAIMAGAYFGDRVSPMSSGARLLSDITNTDYYNNFKIWIKTCIVPYVASAVIYIILGSTHTAQVMHVEVIDSFTREFNLHWVLILPAVMIVLLSVFKIKVQINLVFNIIFSSVLAFTVQKFTPIQLVSTLVFGFKMQGGELSEMLSGGGVFSMSRAIVIIFISASYVGIFEETKMLRGFETHLGNINNKIGAFATTMLTGFVTAAVSCNQTLSIMLTNQLCKGHYTSNSKLASDISNTAVLIAAFIPWSVACTLPLTVIGGDYRCLPFAFFIYLTPLYNLIVEQAKRFYVIKREKLIYSNNKQ